MLFAAVAPPAGALRFEAVLAGNGKTSIRYRDPAATPDGVTALTLGAGAQGKASIAAKGKGANLGLPFLPLPLPLRVQLQSGSAACFEATFSTSARNDAKAFKAKPN